jgi:hypothetical protein
MQSSNKIQVTFLSRHEGLLKSLSKASSEQFGFSNNGKVDQVAGTAGPWFALMLDWISPGTSAEAAAMLISAYIGRCLSPDGGRFDRVTDLEFGIVFQSKKRSASTSISTSALADARAMIANALVAIGYS